MIWSAIKENIGFVAIFTAMMVAILFLHGCQGLETMNDPAKLACNASCDNSGVCTVNLAMTGSNVSRSRKITLDTPTQTKVGLDE